MSDTATATRPKRALPILSGVLPVERSRIGAEAVAGVTLAALAIPEVMGYSNIAGMPVITGLYTLVLPLLVFAVFGSSRHLVVGADSATAAVMAAVSSPPPEVAPCVVIDTAPAGAVSASAKTSVFCSGSHSGVSLGPQLS